MGSVSEDEVLLSWRALRAFRSGARPGCAPRGKPPASAWPLSGRCPRWHGQPDDRQAILTESVAETERRQAAWPCARLLEALPPGVTRIGAGNR